MTEQSQVVVKLSKPATALHEALIRHAKGILKAWETWFEQTRAT
jgi:hypothetical protein